MKQGKTKTKQNNLISKKHTDKLSQISPFPTTSKILKCKF